MKRLLTISFFALAVAAVQAQTFPGNADGNLLPAQADLPKTGGQIQNGATNSFSVQHTAGTANNGTTTSAAGRQNTIISNVTCDPNVVGTTTFQFGGFTGKATGGDDSVGGMMIRGGFKLGAGWALKPGHAMGWVQRYKETGGAGTSTIDAPGPSPLYPSYTVPGITTGLVDLPFDGFAGNTITSLDFESVLVCWDTAKPKDLFGLGSFLWGYSYDNPNKTITSTYALVFTPPITGTFTSLFDAEFGTAGTKGKDWTLTAGCDDCFQAVPEPASLAAVGLGVLALARRRKRRG